jgi:hypothetical protein
MELRRPIMPWFGNLTAERRSQLLTTDVTIDAFWHWCEWPLRSLMPMRCCFHRTAPASLKRAPQFLEAAILMALIFLKIVHGFDEPEITSWDVMYRLSHASSCSADSSGSHQKELILINSVARR